MFAGDSLTDARHREPEFEPLGYGFVAQLAGTLPDGPWVTVNAGVAGNTVRDLRARWAADFAASAADAVNILVGINDVWRRFTHDELTTAEDYERVYREILIELQRTTGPVFLCEPFLIPIDADQQAWCSDLDEKREVVARLADEFGATFVPLHEALNADARARGTDTVTRDGVHLTRDGHRLLAEHWRTVAAPHLQF